MKTEGIESIPNGGLRISTSTFSRIKAFQGGGVYWDHQDLIRESLGDFLPPVQQVQEAEKRFGIFRKNFAGKEVLCKSTPVGSARVPEEQVRRLTDALDAFKRRADAPDTQQNAKDVIQQFRLPDISKDPDLYRLCGPWWDRKLQVIWGCERTPDSSLAPVAAVAKLPIDKAYGLKRTLSLLALLLLLCALLAALFWGWPHVKKWTAKKFNKPPVAALSLDRLDETNRIATISDAESRDPDGTIQQWLVAWGDGKDQAFAQPPLGVSHTYDTDRDYLIQLWCVDNFGATSAPPASAEAKFDFLQRQATAAALRKANEDARSANEAKKKAEDDARIADGAKKKAQEDARIADEAKKKAQDDARIADEAKKKAQAEAAQPKPEAKKPEQQASNLVPEQPAPNGASSEPDLKAPWTNSPPSKPNQERTETPKGAEALVQSLNAIEIQKSSVGRFDKDGLLEAILVVRDTRFPNAPLQILSWQINGEIEKTGNAQYTVKLPVGTHTVRVEVVRSTLRKTASADVIISAEQKQSTEPQIEIVPKD